MSAKQEPDLRICYGCAHFWISMGTPYWSELTPGSDWEMACHKDHWRFDPETCNELQFRRCLETAETCPDWTLRPMTWERCARGVDV